MTRLAIIAGVLMVALLFLDGFSPRAVDDFSVSVDGLFLSFSTGSCNAERLDARVEEHSNRVVLWPIIEGSDHGSDCLDHFHVILSEPLGDRIVVDGRTGKRFRPELSYELPNPSREVQATRVSEDGMTLTFSVDACPDSVGVVLDERPTEVMVEVSPLWLDEGCTATLTEPLRDRPVVDARSGKVLVLGGGPLGS